MSRWILFSVFVVWGIVGCRSHNEKLQVLKIDQKQLEVEVADSPEEWGQGLMYRKSLSNNQGMLFVFPRPRRASFWMKNTFVPLSIAFLNREGEILEIREMFPLDETPIMSWSSEVWFALEVNQGWFEKNAIKVGDRCEVEKISKAF